MAIRAVSKFIYEFAGKFTRDSTSSMAASLAFYASLSLAPILILFVTVAAHISSPLKQELITQIEPVMGHEAARAIEVVMEGAKARDDLTSLASLVGIATLLISASLIFGELHTAFNRIFNVPERTYEQTGIFSLVWRHLEVRLYHMLTAFVFVLAIIFSLITSSLISAIVDFEQRALASAVNISSSFLFYIVFFSALFRYMPDSRQPWACAFKGGALTATLFVIGKEVIGIYLGNSAIGSPYGAAGSVIVLLVWIYYSTMITFIGAQVSSILLKINKINDLAPDLS